MQHFNPGQYRSTCMKSTEDIIASSSKPISRLWKKSVVKKNTFSLNSHNDERDIQVLRARKALDPSIRYKRGEQILKDKNLIQTGYLIPSATELYCSNNSRKKQNCSLLKNILDEDLSWTQKRFFKIQKNNANSLKKPYIFRKSLKS